DRLRDGEDPGGLEDLRRESRRRQPRHHLPRYVRERSSGARDRRPDQVARRQEPRAARREGRQVVMRLEGDSLLIDGALTLATVPALAGAVRDHLRQGVRVIDFRGVTEVDSSAVALALEWLRQPPPRASALRLPHL